MQNRFSLQIFFDFSSTVGEKVLTVSVVPDAPYVILRDNSDSSLTGNDRFEGYVVDLVDTIAKMLRKDNLLYTIFDFFFVFSTFLQTSTTHSK